MADTSELIRTRAGLRNDDGQDEPESENDYSPLSFVHPLVLLHDQWRIANRLGVPVAGSIKPTHNLLVLGKGLSFTVKSGSFGFEKHGLKQVAMKIPNFNQTGPTFRSKAETERARSILNEVHILTHSPLRSATSIVQLLGLTWTETPDAEENITLMLMMEQAELGTLAEYQSQKDRLPFKVKYQLCYDISNGLKALHACGIVHGDVKAENVLIFTHTDGTPLAKVSDFGTAVILGVRPGTPVDDDPEIQLSVGTQPWIAPEAYQPVKRSKLHFTDIYSFGLLAWKTLIDGANPFDDYDLPRETNARMEKIETLKREFSASHAGMALAKILQSIDVRLSSLDEFGMMWLFLKTIACEPEKRSLSAAFDHGKHEEIPHDKRLLLKPLTLDILETTIEPDCVNNKRLDVELQNQLVDAYHKTLETAGTIKQQSPNHPYAQSYILQCSWALTIFRLGSIGSWSGTIAEDILPLVWTICQSGQGRERQTARSLLFSLAETCSEFSQSPTLSNLIDAAIEAASDGTFPLVYSIRRYHQSSQRGITYFPSCKIAYPTKETIDAVTRLDNFAESFAERGWKMPFSNALLPDIAKLKLDMFSNVPSSDDSTITRAKSQLLAACKNGDKEATMEILQKGCSADQRSSLGESCLHWLCAFSENDIGEISERLYENGADLLAVASDPSLTALLESNRHAQLGLTYKDNPLCRCVSTGSLVAVQALTRLFLIHDMEASSKFSIIYEASVLACALHLANILKHLIFELESQCQSILNSKLGSMRFEIWRTHLFRAATLVEVENFRFSLHGKLMDEAMKDTFIVLEEYGNVPDSVLPYVAMTQKPVSPIFVAIKLGSQRVCTHLATHTKWKDQMEVIDPNSGFDPLCHAIHNQWMSFFEALVKQGVRLDFPDGYPETHFLKYNKSTYLHLCADLNAPSRSVELLIEKGLPIDQVDGSDRTVLFVAICRDAIDIARTLLRHGEDLNRPLDGGFTLLGQVMRFKNRSKVNNMERAISNLIHLAKEFNIVLNPVVHEAQQLNIFHMAAGIILEEEQHHQTTQILIDCFGPELLNSASSKGSYPIHEAIGVVNIPAIEVFLQSKVDLDVKDPYGNDLLEITRVCMLSMAQDAAEQKKYAARFARRTERMLDIIENAKNWAGAEEFFKLVRTLEFQLEPLAEQSTLISHVDPRREQIYNMVAEACSSSLTVLTDWLEVFEFGRHINRAISPTFTFVLRCHFEVDGDVLLSEDDMQTIYEHYPWMVKTVSERQLGGLQQAAVMQYYLMLFRDQLRADKEESNSADQEESEGTVLDEHDQLFVKLAERISAYNYPYQQVMVKYPGRLSHDWRYALDEAKYGSILPEGLFAEMEAWDELMKSGTLAPMEFSPEFHELHFKPPLQKVDLAFANNFKPIFRWALYCSCVDQPFEPFSEEYVSELVARGSDTNGEKKTGYLREADRCYHKTHYFPIDMPPPTVRPGYDFSGNPRQPFLSGFDEIGV